MKDWRHRRANTAATKGPRGRCHTCKHEPIKTIDWLGLWALSLGFCAIALAGIAYFLGGDNIGASFILIDAAGIITLIVRAAAEPEEHS